MYANTVFKATTSGCAAAACPGGAAACFEHGTGWCRRGVARGHAEGSQAQRPNARGGEGTRARLCAATSTSFWDHFSRISQDFSALCAPCDVLYFVPMRIECGCGCACDPTVCPIRRVCRVSQLNESAGISPIGQVRQLRHQFGRVTRLPQQYSIPPTCRVTCSAACQCSPGADWCLRSDVITDSRLQGLIGVLLSTCVAYNDNSNDRFSKQAILDTITKGVGYGTPSCLPISRTFPSSS